MNKMPAIAILALCFLPAAGPFSGAVFAQDAAPSPAVSSPGGAKVGGIDITADSLEYEADKKLLTGRGHVVVRYRGDILNADFVSVRTDTQDARAVGNVKFDREGQIWEGHELTYNFRTRVGDFGAFRAFIHPYYVTAEGSRRTGPDEIILERARITTCEGDRPEFYLRAREARLIKGQTLKARGVVFFLGFVPLFYVPAWTKQVAGDSTDVDVVPGYSSRMGPYLLTAYNYRLNPAARAATHLDYRSKRGVGVGQDFLWGDPDLAYEGGLKAYYTQDDSPFENRSEAETQEYAELVNPDRYRIKLSDTRSTSDRGYLSTEINYLSDPLVLEDFFDEEYRHKVQPENRVSLVHRGDRFTAGLEVSKRLNDFYENVDRVPEASLDVPRLRLADSPFYYESENSAAFLEKVFPEEDGRESYDAFRVDSSHLFFYPTRHFGFLNVIPRAGYRGTHYSKTYEQSTVTNLVSETDTNGVTTLTNVIQTLSTELGSDLRSLYELGFELSFKAFRVIHDDGLSDADRGLRHVVEPYALYTYIPEPNLLPEQLPQFDRVDELDQRNDVKFGVRNKLQTKRRKHVHDLVDADVWTTYRIEKQDGQEDFSDYFFDTELRLMDAWQMDFDGAYDSYEGELSRFNTQLALFAPDRSRLALEYRYQRDRRDQVAGELDLFPEDPWSFTAYARYDLETSELDETSLFVKHTTRCLGYGVGYKQIFRGEEPDDVQFWCQLWLLAFPKSSVELGL